MAADTVELSQASPSGATRLRVDSAGRRPGVGRSGAPRAWLAGTLLLTLGALVGAMVMAPPPSTSPRRGLSWLLFIGSSAHVAGTGWLYTLPDVRAYAREHPTRYLYAPIGLVAVAALVAALMPAAGLAWLLLPCFAWQFVHFQKQNLGMAALAASSRGVAGLRPLELRSLCFAFPAFVFQSPYAAVGGMTIAHGLQYLLLVGLVAAGGSREGRASLPKVSPSRVSVDDRSASDI